VLDIANFLRSDIFVALVCAWIGFWLLVSLLVRRAKGKPIFAPEAEGLLFSEKWTSGRSRRNWWTKLSNAKNCLFVGVGRDTVSIHLHFPFSLGFVPELSDFDQEIPIARITRVEKQKRFLREIVYLEFSDDLGAPRGFELRLRHADQFIAAIRGHQQARL
jgi:hypothetical protein